MSQDPKDQIYNFDLVFIFPRPVNQHSVSKRFNKNTFVNTLLGVRSLKNTMGQQVEYIDEARRIFRSDRCYLDEQMQPNTELEALSHQVSLAPMTQVRCRLDSRAVRGAAGL
jgi:hypothetical protein